jgi:hypothetical protein
VILCTRQTWVLVPSTTLTFCAVLNRSLRTSVFVFGKWSTHLSHTAIKWKGCVMAHGGCSQCSQWQTEPAALRHSPGNAALAEDER